MSSPLEDLNTFDGVAFKGWMADLALCDYNRIGHAVNAQCSWCYIIWGCDGTAFPMLHQAGLILEGRLLMNTCRKWWSDSIKAVFPLSQYQTAQALCQEVLWCSRGHGRSWLPVIINDLFTQIFLLESCSNSVVDDYILKSHSSYSFLCQLCHCSIVKLLLCFTPQAAVLQWGLKWAVLEAHKAF